MNRFGKLLAGVGVLLLIAFVALVRCSDGKGPGISAYRPEDRSRAPSGGGLVIPVAGVAGAALVDSFGDARGDGNRSHGALDIPAPRGTAVLAAADGTVEKIFESGLGGHTVYIRSFDNGTVYYYAHLDTYAPDLREGVKVTAGQRIGSVGSSGDADPAGPHLHFEIKRMAAGESWHEGTGIDPYPLLAGKAAGG